MYTALYDDSTLKIPSFGAESIVLIKKVQLRSVQSSSIICRVATLQYLTENRLFLLLSCLPSTMEPERDPPVSDELSISARLLGLLGPACLRDSAQEVA